MEKAITSAVQALEGLFNLESKDCPTKLLEHSPRPARVIAAHKLFLGVMLPGKFDSEIPAGVQFGNYLREQLAKGWELLRPELARAIPLRWLGAAGSSEHITPCDAEAEADKVLTTFFAGLSSVRSFIIEDIRAAYNGDPAALSFAEVQLAYPGVLAIASHRLAHELYKLQVPVIPRIMSEWTHTETGVDIHPGAKVGKGFFIDHATGVVIGETTTIGNNVKLYQGVTLGAKSFPLDDKGNPIKHIQRHPTVEDDVVIYANATILGGSTVIGKGSTIGGNVFLMESVPANTAVRYAPPELKIKSE